MPQFLALVMLMALLSPGTAQDSVDTLTWTNVKDLREGAFTVDVPAGWQVEGGLFRFSSFDTRPMVRVTSPDGGIVITRGDYNVPGFEIPTAASQSLGYSEGQSLHPGSMLLHYMTGEEFAGWYVSGMNGILPSDNIPAIGCTDIYITDSQDRTDLSQEYSQTHPGVNLDVGEVRFECRKDGQPLRGYQFVATQSIPGSISWNVYFLSGYIAPPDEEQMAEEVMNRIASSFKFKQDWFMAQVGGGSNSTDSPDW